MKSEPDPDAEYQLVVRGELDDRYGCLFEGDADGEGRRHIRPCREDSRPSAALRLHRANRESRTPASLANVRETRDSGSMLKAAASHAPSVVGVAWIDDDLTAEGIAHAEP